jgi:hypothetical protein
MFISCFTLEWQGDRGGNWLKLLVSWASLLLSDGREGDRDVTLLCTVDGKKGEEMCDVRVKKGRN